MRSATLLFQFALAIPLMGQAPPWIWATALTGGGVHMESVCASDLNGCFASGRLTQHLLLPFDTLEYSDAADNFLIHVDTLGNATWAAQVGEPVVSMHALENGGVSCMVIYEGQTSIAGQSLAGSATGYSAAVAEFNAFGALQDLVNIPGIVDGNITDGPKAHHAAGGGIAVTANIQDSLQVRGEWVVGEGVALARLSPQGDPIWTRSIDAHTATLGTIHIDSSGRVVTCALAGNEADAEVLSYDGNGILEWSLPIELGWGILDPPVLATRPNGHVLIGSAYYTQGPIGAGTILTVLEADGQGNVLWSTSTSNATNWGNDIRSLSALEDGKVLVGGYLVGNLTFGDFSLMGNGPGGFVATVDPSTGWQWGATETSGNVNGTTAAPGTNSRIYITGSAETGAWFGSHQVPPTVGGFAGFVACLGDVALSARISAAEGSALEAWPNPASDMLYVRIPQRAPIHVLDAQGRIVHASQGQVGVNTLDVHDLKPGPYVITTDQSFVRYLKH